jgi:hypothetical protein
MKICRGILIAGLAPVVAAQANAHCVVGARFFPATLTIDDPCVADELALPTIASFKNGDDPSTREIDISAEFSKRISDKFGISIGTDWTQLSPAGASRVNGFQNLQRYRGGRHRSNALLSRRPVSGQHWQAALRHQRDAREIAARQLTCVQSGSSAAPPPLLCSAASPPRMPFSTRPRRESAAPFARRRAKSR